MRTKHLKLAAMLLLATLNSQLSTLHAQGSLTPPGVPAPTMKTLDQVEPRTDVLTLAGDGGNRFIIAQPGSYYLTTNIVGVAGKNGIGIASGNVTLDLNGFALLGVPSSLVGVKVNGTYTNLTVRNGAVSGWGGDGVDAYSAGLPRNVVLERLAVSGNGGRGIETEAVSVVRDCLSQSNYTDGIYCIGGLISGCVSRDNGGTGIFAVSSVVRDCQVQSSGYYGIYAESSVVRDCRVGSSGNDGIHANPSVVRDCWVESSAGDGIYAAPGTVSGCFVKDSMRSGIYVNLPGSQISGNTCIGNNTTASVGHAGIYVNDSNNRIEDNHVSATGGILGIKVNSPTYVNNVVIKNTVSGNGINNYAGFAGNDFGPVGTAAASTSPWANISH